MKLAPEINYAEAYLTFRCNFNCGYCINKFNGLEKRVEIRGNDWVKLVNAIDFGGLSLTLGGGEPTLHPDFFEIVEGITPKIDLLTNLNFNVEEFIKNVDPGKFTVSDKPSYKPIRVSYHVGMSQPETLVKKAKRLQNAGFNVGIFGVRHPHLINENMEMNWLCNEHGVFFYDKDFLGKVDDKMYGYFKYPDGFTGEKKEVECRLRELLISPDGKFFKCHRDLYHNENPIDGEYKFRRCSNFGDCNPCDLKLKTNKYLGGIDCQTEIHERK